MFLVKKVDQNAVGENAQMKTSLFVAVLVAVLTILAIAAYVASRGTGTPSDDAIYGAYWAEWISERSLAV